MGWKGKKPTKFTDTVKEAADRKARGAALVAYSTAILNTPVDTGRLRGNWQVGVGTDPKNALLTPTRERNKYPAPSVEELAPGSAYGKVIYIVNNLPYAQAINDGLGKGKRTAHRMVELATKAAYDWSERQ